MIFIRACFLILIAGTVLLASGASAENSPVLSDFKETTLLRVLDNGMTVIVHESHSSPLVALRAYVKTGSIFERKYLGCGISHYLEHVVAGGTTSRRTEKQYKRWSQSSGAISNAYTTFDHTCYHITTGSEFTDDALAVLSEWLMSCAFDSSEVTREKGVILKEILTNETPRAREEIRFRQLCYLAHPLRHPVIGYEPLFSAIEPTDISSYYERNYIPNNVVFVAAGEFDRFEMVSRISTAFADWERRPFEPPVLAVEKSLTGERRIIDEFDITYPILRLAWPSVKLSDPDSYNLDALSMVLGGGESSRLHRLLVDQRRLVADIDCYNWTPGYVDGFLTVSAEIFEKDSTEVVERLILEEVERIRLKGVSRKEIEKITNNVYAEFIIGLESIETRADLLGTSFLYANDPFFSATYHEKYGRIKPKQIRNIARKYLDPEKKIVMVSYPEGTYFHSESCMPDKSAIQEQSAFSHEKREVTKAASQASEITGLSSPYHVNECLLDNGALLLHKEKAELPTLAISIYFRGGVIEESRIEQGITNLMMEMLKEGAGEFSASETSEIVESRGISFDVAVYEDVSAINYRFLKRDFGVVKRLISAVLSEPEFSSKLIELKKQTIQFEIDSAKDDPYVLSAEFFKQSLYGEHPYGYRILGTPESLERITGRDLRRWFSRMIVPDRMVISIVGDLDIEGAKQIAGNFVKVMSVKELNEPITAIRDFAVSSIHPLSEHKTMVNHYKFPQVELYWAFPSVGVSHPDFFPLKIITGLYSGNDSRLYNSLRGETDLVYFVFGYQDVTAFPSAFIIHTQTSVENIDEVRTIIDHEIHRLLEEPLPNSTLERVKKEIKAELPLYFETNAQIARRAGYYAAIGESGDYFDRFLRGIDSISADQIQTVASRYFQRGLCAISRPHPVPLKEKTE